MPHSPERSGEIRACGSGRLVFLDYDGSLSLDAASPEPATSPEWMREALMELSRNPAVPIVSSLPGTVYC